MFSSKTEPTLSLDDKRNLLIRLYHENGNTEQKLFRILSGSLHYFRVLPQLWSDRIQKMKAAGLNTVETYIPWNLHEPEKGQYKFQEGLADIVTFLELIRSHEMFAIIRPSGFICAEYEWGGLPSWLLKDNNMRVRTTYSGFMAALKKYYDVLLPILAEYQYNRQGQGPIIAFQIENEYGSYGSDKEYLEQIKSIYEANGLTELFLTSDGAEVLKNGTLTDVWATVNFQRYIQANLDKLRLFRPNKHLMITEYWTGWFDYWGGTHNTGSRGYYDAEQLESDVEEILNLKDVSINFYMFHGGTNFGFTSGGHHFPKSHYNPLVTSYDYDAPLNESGDPTPKYYAIRKVIKNFYEKNPSLLIFNTKRSVISNPEYFLPTVPLSSQKASYGTIEIKGYKTFLEILEDDLLTTKSHSQNMINMEKLSINNFSGQSTGFIVYHTVLNNLPKSKIQLNVTSVADNAIVLINNNVIFNSKHTDNQFYIDLPSTDEEQLSLHILVENMGRINFGPTIDNSRKGIKGEVLLNNDVSIKNWTIYSLEFRKGISGVTNWNKVDKLNRQLNMGPCLFLGAFSIEDETPYDTYLSLPQFTKGVAFVNGFNIGRYWNIGPQKTLYIPAQLLFKGFNQIQVFELYTFGQSDILVFLNGKNIISSSLEQIKNDITILSRQKEKIIIGTCRLSSNSNNNNNNTIIASYLASLSFVEFSNIAINFLRDKFITKTKSSEHLAESRNILSLLNPFTKKKRLLTTNGEQKDDGDSAIVLASNDLNRNQKSKRNPSPNRDSGFIETDGTNGSLLTQHSGSSRLRSKTSLEKSDSRDDSFESFPPSLKNGILNLNNHTDDLLTTTIPDTIKIMPENSGLKYSDLLFEKFQKSRREPQTTPMTDGCNIYTHHSNPVRQYDETVILRGREIAYEAANASSQISHNINSISNETEFKYRLPIVQSYSKDQIRELYGELDEKTHPLKENIWTPYTIQHHQPPIDAWDENLSLSISKPDTYFVKRTDFTSKSNWDFETSFEQTLSNGQSKTVKNKFECPLPKFRLDTDGGKINKKQVHSHPFLSTGLSNPRLDTQQPRSSIDKQIENRNNINISSPSEDLSLKPIVEEELNIPLNLIKGSFRTSLGSPLYDNARIYVTEANPITFSGTPTEEQKGFVQSIQDTKSAIKIEMNLSEKTNTIHDKKQKLEKSAFIDLSPNSSEQDSTIKSNWTTPGLNGMYLEPYMDRLYNIDEHWHQSKLTMNSTDFKYVDVQKENQSSTNESEHLSPTIIGFDDLSYGSTTPPIQDKKTPTLSQTEFHSILDLEATSLNGEYSYHTAASNSTRKKSVRAYSNIREKQENQRLHSTASTDNDTSDSTLKQTKFDIYESFTSAEDSFYDALASPTTVESESTLSMTNNLSSLIQQINEINRTEHVNTQNICDIIKSIQDDKQNVKELSEISNTDQYTTNTSFTEEGISIQSQNDNLSRIILQINDLAFLSQRRLSPEGSERKLFDKNSSSKSEDEMQRYHQDPTTVNALTTIVQNINHLTETDKMQSLEKIINPFSSHNYHQLYKVYNSTNVISTIDDDMSIPNEFESKPSEYINNLHFVDDDLAMPTVEMTDIIWESHEKEANTESENLTALVSSITTLSQKPILSTNVNNLLLMYDDDVITRKNSKKLIDISTENNVHNLANLVEHIYQHSIQNHSITSNNEQSYDLVDQVSHANLSNIVSEIMEHHKTASTLTSKTTWTKSSSLANEKQPTKIFEQELIVENLKSIINEINDKQEQSLPLKAEDEQFQVNHLSQIVGDTFLIGSKYTYPKVFGTVKEDENVQQPKQSVFQETNSTSSSNNIGDYSNNLTPMTLTINITQKPFAQQSINENIVEQPEKLYEEYGYRRITRDPDTNSVVEKLEECIRRYKNNIDDYQTASENVDSQINKLSNPLKSDFYASNHDFDETLPFDPVSSSTYSESEMRDISGRSSVVLQAPTSTSLITLNLRKTLDSPTQSRITDMQNMPQLNTLSTTTSDIGACEYKKVEFNNSVDVHLTILFQS
ncbi:unnamed protein product [Didymodactylos carnosus]|uniref:Beta-galactosidase n=1 Tax=Didymodactylos carnosus TaxID=1234261 RepID=A0A8S2CW61_9BILA|nr:unnamed protein product [Didymodactylos carnosus]CAF3602977.1 unnamed protein product [Didymodactylos carnosus]